MNAARLQEALARARAHSPFLRRLIESQTALAAQLADGALDAALASARAAAPAGTDVGVTLRRQRAALALVAGIADLAGVWSLAEVTRALSDFADAALDQAVRAAILERMPEAEPRGFAVIALGKLGGRELNYSSDIDPIFLFDPATLPRRAREEPGEAAVRYGRRVIQLLSERTEHGHVFRVDMRLRPSPEVSPIALPVETAIAYYESSALAWEQAAFIRARAAAGDAALGERFLSAIRPFVWRRSMDFGQLGNIAGMSAAIRDHFGAVQAFGPGYDLKRGRGGIRECEFFAQVHQLIHGGRDPALRTADTREALGALAAAGHVGADDAAAIAGHYALLRTIEHRVQMIDDRQTHALPPDPARLDAVARLHGLADGPALLGLLRGPVAEVGAIYDRLIGNGAPAAARVPEGGPPLDEWLMARGHADPVDPARRIARWRSGGARAIRSSAAREAFEAVLPALLTALGASPDPARAIARFDTMIERLPSAINFFRLIEARPGLGSLIGDILSHAPVLADALSQRAELVEGLIDATALDLPGDVDALVAMIGGSGSAGYEALLDSVRATVGELRFALGAQLVAGRHDPLAVAAGYARVAEAALVVLTRATIDAFETAHGRVPGGELVILALGRLGGGALTHRSDLDLVFLFTGDHAAVSDGPRPLGATHYFNRLAARVISALSVPTASGPLYEVDTRLRPSGAKGLLAVSLESFADYQRGQAWVFEHMALTRARAVFGSVEARRTVGNVIADVLAAPRTGEGLAAEVRAMRREMAEHKPPAGLLDVKLLPGGLVDLEFVVHYLQLGLRAGITPRLDRAIADQVAAGLLAPEVAAADALLSRLLLLFRLTAPDAGEPPRATRALIARAVALPDWNAVLAGIDDARQEIGRAWSRWLGDRT